MIKICVSAAAFATPAIARASQVRIVIVGGGFGGAAAAKTAKALMPEAKVILITNQDQFWMCPGSNSVIAGLQSMESVMVTYHGLRNHGIDVLIASAEAIDADKHIVRTSTDDHIHYDKLILSPGIDFAYQGIEGLTEADSDQIPHAWKAGAQTELLHRQLTEMPLDGLFILSIPAAPYRCPPAPAERACLIAHYLKIHKPGARILILDAKDEFPFQDHFMVAWDELYSDIIEFRSIADDGLVRGVDPATRTVFTDFDEIQADVLNVIPPQTAGKIAITSGATDSSGWCPIEMPSFKSKLLPDVYVIGDAALVDALPKAGSTAASQARVAVTHLISEMGGSKPPPANWIANCFSLASPDYGIRLGASYIFEDDHVVRNATDFSTIDADLDSREADARYTELWLQQIKQEVWG